MQHLATKAPTTVKLEPGLLDMFTFNQEPLLRKLGLVTRLKVVDAGAGVPELLVPFQVCTKGKRLKPAQAKLLVSWMSYWCFDHFFYLF